MSIGRHATYNLVGALIPLALALATVPLYIKLIGAERYGVLSIAFLFLGYFGLFDLGLGRATTYRISALADAPPQDRADVLRTAVAVNLGMGLVGALVLWGGAHIFFSDFFQADPGLRDEIVASLPLLGLCLPVATMTGVLTGALQARQRFLETNAISVLSTALFQILPIIVAWTNGPALAPLLVAALAARGLAILVLVWRCHAAIGRGTRTRFVKSEVRLLLGFGGWVLVDGLLTPMLAMIDRFAIGARLGGTAVTIYTVPFQLAQRITIFPGALLNALFPRLPTASEEQRRAFGDRSIRVILAAISTPILGAILLIHPFFDLWLGRTLGPPSADVGVLILIGFWLNAIAWAPFVWLQGTGRPDLVAKMHLIQVPPYLVLLYFGLTWYGLTGVAGVLILRNLADLAMLSAAARQLHSLKWVAAFAAVLALAVVGALSFGHAAIERAAALPVLGLAVAWLCWLVLPVDMRGTVRRLVPGLGR